MKAYILFHECKNQNYKIHLLKILIIFVPQFPRDCDRIIPGSGWIRFPGM